MHGMEGIDESILAATAADFTWQDTPPPSINIDTAFTTSLSSPVSSFWSSTTRASSPDMPPTSVPPQFASIPPYLLANKATPSPLEPHTAPSWEFMAQMQSTHKNAEPTRSHNRSRNTSNSSISLASDDQAMSPIPEAEGDLLLFAMAAPHLPRQGVFAPSPAPASTRSSYTDRSRAVSTTPLPSRFEAETLTTEFMHHVETVSPHAYGLASDSFAQLCEMVYSNSQTSSLSNLCVSMSMARFHVFLGMATGMKLRIKDKPENTNALLDTCYDLAMQQTSNSTFWQEEGGVEATQLLAIFAGICKTPSVEPTPLQHSFSW